MLTSFHQLIEELALAPKQLTTKELAAAEGCCQRTAQRRLKKGRGPTYNQQKALAGAARSERKVSAGGLAR
jgi:hypothetical protein